jgi:hypothetical protein
LSIENRGSNLQIYPAKLFSLKAGSFLARSFLLYPHVMQTSRKPRNFSPIAMSTVLILVSWMTIHFPSHRQFRTGNILTFTASPAGALSERLFETIWCLSLILCIVCIFRKNWLGLILFVIGTACTFFVLGDGLDYAGQFVDEASIKDSQGNEYHLLNSNFLRGTNVAIAKVIGRSANETKYEVLVQDPGKEGTLRVVRKQRVPDTASLYITPNGLLVGLLYGSYCVNAFDLKNKTPYGAEVSEHKIRELSPFVLLRDGDVPNEKDFDSLLHLSKEDRADIEVVRKDLKSPNATVRDLAARYLKEIGKLDEK